MESLPGPKNKCVANHSLVAYAKSLCKEMWFNCLQGHLGP